MKNTDNNIFNPGTEVWIVEGRLGSGRCYVTKGRVSNIFCTGEIISVMYGNSGTITHKDRVFISEEKARKALPYWNSGDLSITSAIKSHNRWSRRQNMSEAVKNMLRHMYAEAIKSTKGSISNERIWEKGYVGNDPNPHTENISLLEEYLEELEALLKELDE